MSPMPTSSTPCMTMASRDQRASQYSVAPVAIAKAAITGRLARNSIPFERMRRFTQMVRGILVERISFASRRKARVQSDTAPVNHIHGSRALSRNTM